jgi:prophage regulatory protein
MSEATKPKRLLAVQEVVARTGLSKATVYRLERLGRFPRHVKITPTRSAWAEHEIDAYIDSLLAQRPEPKAPRSRRTVSAA